MLLSIVLVEATRQWFVFMFLYFVRLTNYFCVPQKCDRTVFEKPRCKYVENDKKNRLPVDAVTAVDCRIA